MKKSDKGGKLFAGISKFFKDISIEMKKVVWPTWSQVRNNTGIVLICILVIGIAIWILDAIFGWGVKTIVK